MNWLLFSIGVVVEIWLVVDTVRKYNRADQERRALLDPALWRSDQ